MGGSDDGDAGAVRPDDEAGARDQSNHSEGEDGARHASPLAEPPPPRGREGAEDSPQGGREPRPWWPAGATAEVVAEARRHYELTGMPVSAIQSKFRWTAWQLRKLRENEQWTTRPAVATPGPLQGRKAVGAEAATFRLRRLIVFGIGMLERKTAGEGMNEGNAEALVALCRAQEIMMRLERAKNGTIREKKKNDDGVDFRDDPLWLAAEFARRNSPVAGRADVRGEGRVLQDVEPGRAADASRQLGRAGAGGSAST